METTKEQRKQTAINIMNTLGIYKPYIKGFREKDLVCFFERFGGYYDYQEDILFEKRKELEEKYGFTVYAITHSYIDDMELWSMLIIPKNEEDQADLVQYLGNGQYVAFSYTWNATCPDYSEFGDAVIQSAYGGIRRVA